MCIKVSQIMHILTGTCHGMCTKVSLVLIISTGSCYEGVTNCNYFHRYVPWNVHEGVAPGVFDFEGQQDLVKFVKTAQEAGLLVILRAGPYICGEWEFVRTFIR